MAVSILHRVTGSGMATVGIGLFLWWLVAAATGADTYATFRTFAVSPFGYVFWVGLTASFFQHLASGFRHLVMDTGVGYDLVTARRSAIATFLFSVVMTALVWGGALLAEG